MILDCPRCAERIQSEAKICRFCHAEFTTEELADFHQKMLAVAADFEMAKVAHAAEIAAQQKRQNENGCMALMVFAVVAILVAGLAFLRDGGFSVGHTQSTSGATTVDQNMAASRGISVDDLNDPKRHYGYTADDRALLERNGVSESEARTLEKLECSQGADC
jgi:RNA polymerase subunit RPABC4/transcription elongation factor Spt4